MFIMFILKGVLQDTMGGLQDPLLYLHYISTIGRSIGSLYCLFIIYILKGVLLDPMGGLQDALLIVFLCLYDRAFYRIPWAVYRIPFC